MSCHKVIFYEPLSFENIDMKIDVILELRKSYICLMWTKPKVVLRLL